MRQALVKRGETATAQKLKGVRVYTVGHSTRSLSDFVALLRRFGIERVVDIRSIPRSLHTPQYNRENLAAKLRATEISYVHLKKLGGRRHATKSSINLGWRNKSFRGYADYMQTRAFQEGMERLVSLAKTKTTAVMCAEAVPWRCHRSLVGDALLVRGAKVIDVLGLAKAKAHVLTPFAEVRGRAITYPSDIAASGAEQTQARLGGSGQP